MDLRQARTIGILTALVDIGAQQGGRRSHNSTGRISRRDNAGSNRSQGAVDGSSESLRNGGGEAIASCERKSNVHSCCQRCKSRARVSVKGIRPSHSGSTTSDSNNIGKTLMRQFLTFAVEPAKRFDLLVVRSRTPLVQFEFLSSS